MSTAPAAIAEPRFLRDGDEEELLEFLNIAFGRWPGRLLPVPAIDYLRWKLRSHREASGRHIVAELDSRIVGARLSLVREVKVKDRVLLTRQGTDLSAHPDHRQSGITTRMQQFHSDELENAFDLGIGITNHPAMVKLDTRAGFRPLANRVQPLRLDLRRYGRRGASADATADGWTTTPVRGFDDRIDAFWNEASKPFDFIVARTRDYVNWRYCDIRSGISSILVAERDDVILGYAALRVSRRKGFIADLLALPERLDVAGSLLSDALERFATAGVRTAMWWLPVHHPYRELARRWDFKPRKAVAVTYRPLRTPLRELAFLDDPEAAVHLAPGDTDLI